MSNQRQNRAGLFPERIERLNEVGFIWNTRKGPKLKPRYPGQTIRGTMVYLELQTGYYTRGFSKLERDDGFERSRHRFVGIGVNLNELFFGRRIEREPELKNLSRLFLEHIQIPHTATRSSNAF